MLVVNLQPQLESSTVGTKAANLGKAMANGIRVPPGFVVTRDALGLFLHHTGLKTPVEEFVSRCLLGENREHAAEFEELCRQIRAAPIPDSLTVAVAEMAASLLAGAPAGVAVRSSGIHEDSATASFAGIYESYLGIRSSESGVHSVSISRERSAAPSLSDALAISLSKVALDIDRLFERFSGTPSA